MTFIYCENKNKNKNSFISTIKIRLINKSIIINITSQIIKHFKKLLIPKRNTKLKELMIEISQNCINIHTKMKNECNMYTTITIIFLINRLIKTMPNFKLGENKQLLQYIGQSTIAAYITCNSEIWGRLQQMGGNL